jgi:hypothetical protein
MVWFPVPGFRFQVVFLKHVTLNFEHFEPWNQNKKMKLLRITTVPISSKFLLKGQLLFMQQNGFEMLAVSADGKEGVK